MSTSHDIELERVDQGTAVATCLRFFATALFFTLLNFSPAFSQSTYSDSWFDDSGAGVIVSAGVTDGSYTHSYVVDTTLHSPNGRSAFGSRRRTGYARADVSLAWDWDDPGDYFTESQHWARCPGDDLNYYSMGTTENSTLTGVSNAQYVNVVQYGDGTGGFVPITGCNVTCMPSSFTATLVCNNQLEYRLRLQLWIATPLGRVCAPRAVQFYTTCGSPHLGQCYEREL